MTVKKSNAGAPTKYRAEYHPKMVELAAQNGFTNTEIARELNIANSTLHVWMKLYPEFSDALKRGKDKVDDAVENMLLKNALGYEEENVKIFCDKGRPVYAPYLKKHKPDTTSQIFWLKNRRPDEWRDKMHIEDDTDFSRQFEKLEGIRKKVFDEEKNNK